MEPILNGISSPDAEVEAKPLNLVTPSIPTKTPVSLLQELAAKQCITPKYDLLQVEGAVHEPTFLYRATVGEFVASGQGQSKKKAKHMAARAVLDQLLGQQAATPLVPSARPAALAELPLLPCEDDAAGNPVGRLQELCMSRRWPPPTYELVHEEGQPHERTFTIACCIGTKAREIGVGKSKKCAKRQASSLMLSKLRDSSPADGASVLDDEDELALKMSSCASLRDGWQPKLAQQGGARVSQFHRSLKTSTAPLVTQLQNLSLDSVFNCSQHLEELAHEQNFEVTWVDIDEQTTEGRHHCLVQLSTLPVAVCYGTGDDPSGAKSDAAHNALEYLKIMVQQ
ncbi:interferon-inducible double-stranded RNA-dependent protein kinase activator A homolog isoform X1 [Amphibalanus amphitrite]|uniref:interferon-inducible double-stranded RNA-dependent protein kinase activator A homolog isoform X1 n=1 Tax=Amphibalanus amphitrite TaxID=1232801 RepID=UPI001C9059F2|nr:interferon-inducible double-stranded RNA-dependent protein kinase activator A homolog isoform X1 [Amphibalanus amphitrite]